MCYFLHSLNVRRLCLVLVLFLVKEIREYMQSYTKINIFYITETVIKLINKTQ